ncbi:hypothetical protein LMG27174_06503 [Paraburkholderia rhynchosiae]|nr:hypothetical protein LMG27174_06503 [Paraburkholderia rhynchosiae]
MVLWRISNYADLKGLGGLRAPGRWHFTGQPVVYLAEHPAGALLETLVHQEIGTTADLADTYQLLKVQVDDGVIISEMAETAYPPDWRDDLAWTQAAGTEWLTRASSALLKVASAVMPFAFHYILNPAHGDAARIEISIAIEVRQDPRILRLLARP